MGQSQGGREPQLGEREQDQSREHGEERMRSTAKEGTFQGDEGGQAKKSP